jgi:hypothetical protein
VSVLASQLAIDKTNAALKAAKEKEGAEAIRLAKEALEQISADAKAAKAAADKEAADKEAADKAKSKLPKCTTLCNDNDCTDEPKAPTERCSAFQLEKGVEFCGDLLQTDGMYKKAANYAETAAKVAKLCTGF